MDRLEEGVARAESDESGESPNSSGIESRTQRTKRGPVTVLFTDLCGYTALSEGLDPEDLRDVMTQVFGGIARIVARYEGHIDKLLGDAALILFGVPQTHEDDAVRAIKTAREIHEFVERQSPRLESKTGRQLHMHSAISTGVIVTADVDHSLADSALGDTVNLASRLLDFAKWDEIVCSDQTRAQAQGYFDFEPLGEHVVRGRENPVDVYRIGHPRAIPATQHRIWGVRARLVGRRDEWARLHEAVHRVQHGETTVICIRGEAGTGKSRLVEDFRDSLDPGEIHWLESSSQPHSQNIPYYPFTQFMGHAWDIRDDDLPDMVRDKIEANVARFEGIPDNSAAYVGALFGVDYPALHGIDPEFWKSQLFSFVRSMLSTEASRGPTVICLGDLHWADPSSLELVRFILTTFQAPALFILTYRPPYDLFAGTSPAGVQYQEIDLRNLSRSEAADMLASLLDTDDIPSSLRDFLQDKAEGNPFYLEELVNSLIESKTLVRDDGSWCIARSLEESDLPLTVLGVIAARLDHLDPSARRVLQEASVVGRGFPAAVLGRITDSPDVESRLVELQRLDLIRVRAFEPELEYEFKHALIQEAAYSSLLKAERREIHERVGFALESMFSDRLPELYETLALHFRSGTSVPRAVDYLVKSGEKSFRRYAHEESHEFYRQAYELLTGIPRDPAMDRLLVQVLNDWAYVIYDRGDMAKLERLLESHSEVAESLGETSGHAMYRVCMSIALHNRERFAEALEHADAALAMALTIDDEYVAACARVWRSYSLSEIGQPDEAVTCAELAIPVLEQNPDYLQEAYSALGFACWTKGDAGRALEVGDALLEIGRAGPSIRATAAGHWVRGEGYLSDGDFEAAARELADSIETSPDPYASIYPRVYLAISYVQMERYPEAEQLLMDVRTISQERGSELTLTPAIALIGVTAFAQGEMTEGMKMLEEAGRIWKERHALMRIATLEAILGQLYLNMVADRSSVTLRTIAHNIGFLARNVLSAAASSEAHFGEALRICEEVGAVGSRGEACLGLGRLYKATRQNDRAQEYALTAIECFEHAGIKTYLQQARELLASLS